MEQRRQLESWLFRMRALLPASCSGSLRVGVGNCVHQLRMEEEESVMALLEAFDLFLPNVISDATREAVAAFCAEISATKRALYFMPEGADDAPYDCTVCGKTVSREDDPQVARGERSQRAIHRADRPQ